MRSSYLVVLLVGLAACGGSRSDGAPGPAPTRDAGPAVAATSDAGDPRVARGAELHLRYCALCHGKDARGYAADNAPSMVSSTFLASADDTFLARSIELGRPGTPMAGYGKDLGGPLSDRDITDLIAFYRQGGPASKPLAPSVGGVAARGAAVYAASCQKCHGDATTRSTAPHLANPTFLALASDPFIRYAIVSGRPGTPMEAFAGKLTDAQIDDVVAFVRGMATVPAVPPAAPAPGPVPDGGPIVMNPKGKPPRFTMREDRFVAAAQIAKAVAEKRKMVIVDARAPSDWVRERIPGAISIPYYELGALDRIPNDGTWVIAYCACPHHASGIIVDELRKRGYKNTAVLDEGVLFWKQQGFPVIGDPSAPAVDHSHHGHAH